MPMTSDATARYNSATYTSGAGGGPLSFRGLEARGDIVAFLDDAVARAFDDLPDRLVGRCLDDQDFSEIFGLLAGLEPRAVDGGLVADFHAVVASQRNLNQFARTLALSGFDLFDDAFDARRGAVLRRQLVGVGRDACRLQRLLHHRDLGQQVAVLLPGRVEIELQAVHLVFELGAHAE